MLAGSEALVTKADSGSCFQSPLAVELPSYSGKPSLNLFR